jgi:hypothetical protein
MEHALRVEVRDALGHIQREGHPDRPGKVLLSHLNQVLKTPNVDVLKGKKIHSKYCMLSNISC